MKPGERVQKRDLGACLYDDCNNLNMVGYEEKRQEDEGPFYFE